MIDLRKSKTAYAVIWDNGQEFEHDYKIVKVFTKEADAKEFRSEFVSSLQSESDYEHVYIEEVDLI